MHNTIEKQHPNPLEEKFTFFWETESPFSQWHPAKFIAPSYLWCMEDFYPALQKEGFAEQLEFTAAEQYMMYAKAVIFMDIEAAKTILKESNPREIKALGRGIKGFNDDIWTGCRYLIVYLANKYKFSQNEPLKQALLATKDTTLVEASPYDKIWGIGLTKDDPKAQKRATWEGLNLLGEVLTALRLEFEQTLSNTEKINPTHQNLKSKI